MNSSPDWEREFNKLDHCSMCGEVWLRCDCRPEDMPEYDEFDDIDEY